MKRILSLAPVLALVALLSSLSLLGKAQNTPVDRHSDHTALPRHEVRVNALAGILRLNPDVSYEYLLNNDLSLGGRLSFLLKENEDYFGTGNLSVAPFVRWHFYNNLLRELGSSAKGFFVEISMPLSYYHMSRPKYSSYYQTYPTYEELPIPREEKSGMGFGITIGAGYKYISPHNWTVETFLMGGRNFTAPEGCEYLAGFGLSIGKKF